jgi:hypothetical protein
MKDIRNCIKPSKHTIKPRKHYLLYRRKIDEFILRKLEDAIALEEALEKEHQEQELEQLDWLQTRRATLRKKF